MVKQEARCPLCGAKMKAVQLLDACEEVIEGELGILACHCPYCQGYLEVLPVAGRLDVGYLRHGRFDIVLTLPAEGLMVLRDTATGALRLRMPDLDWSFSA